ncbi:DUF6220 domain-containing protein [Cohnella sp. REN36]|uniref:DUF6220 domain-containing protein n=1 Tax=Cohnella sp. REN36 TaxID=2887347 RepID=UPI001D1341F9|nr:DUF6220 domain-containing protein [Cohnella sp. REN36]MCC3373874.1 DUF6220 domain-containing protein [Cohnella sp. REN36]
MSNATFRAARILFIALAWLFAVSIALQVFFAGLALFVDSKSWVAHAGFARYVAPLPLLMALCAWGARLPVRLRMRSVGLFGMVIGMFLTAVLSSRIGALSALHPVIALLLFWSSAEILRAFHRPASPSSS